MNPHHCPYCGKENDAASIAAPIFEATATPDIEPTNGDVSLCAACGRLGVFQRVAGVIFVRKPSPKEQTAFDNDSGLTRVLAAWMAAKEKNR